MKTFHIWLMTLGQLINYKQVWQDSSLVSLELAQALCLSQGHLYMGKAPHRVRPALLCNKHTVLTICGDSSHGTMCSHCIRP